MFLYWDCERGKFPDNSMSWTRYTSFIGWIFCIFWVSYEKQTTPMNAACFPWSETTKIKNSQKMDSCQNSVSKFLSISIAVLPNRAEPLSIAIKLHELAILGETFAIMRAAFQACVVVIGEWASLYCRRPLVWCQLGRISVGTNHFFWSQPKLLFVLHNFHPLMCC